MYLVTCDNQIIYDIRVENRIILSPTLDLETGKNGSFSFIIPSNNIGYDLIKEKKSIIQVFQLDMIDNKIVQIELFRGDVSAVKKDFFKRKLVDCERRAFFF